jgi:hypothetical protein
MKQFLTISRCRIDLNCGISASYSFGSLKKRTPFNEVQGGENQIINGILIMKLIL